MPCCCCCPRRSCRSPVASWSCQKSSRLRVIAARIDPFSLLINLYNATKLVLLSVFTSNLETICYERCSKSLLKNTKIPRGFDMRRLKTSLLVVRRAVAVLISAEERKLISSRGDTNKVSCVEAPPQNCPTPYLSYTIFDRKGTPFFVYLLFFNCCKCKVFKI